MSTDPASTNQNLLSQEFPLLADRWVGLGAWCTLWNAQGQLIDPVRQGSTFWKTLWNKGRSLRQELAEAVRGATGGLPASGTPATATRTLLRIEGLRVDCTPIGLHANEKCIVAVCSVSPQCQWGEEFARLCSQLQLDEQLMCTWFGAEPRLSPAQVGSVVALIQRSFQNAADCLTRQSEIDEVTEQLGDAYEELNLNYRVGATMRVTQQPRTYFTQLFEELAKTTPFTTLAAVLYDTDVLDPNDRLIIGGEPIIDESGVLRIAEDLRAAVKQSRNALIINRPSEYPQLKWASGWLERAILVPIICNQARMGVVLVCNHNRDVDFNSTDVRLLHSVVDRSAIYLENVLLYADLNKLLMGLLHALVSSIDAKDPYTCGHSNRVALISKCLAEKAGVPAQESERLYLGGLLHDVGKIGISEIILCKPGRLTPSEVVEMQKHPEIGRNILSGITQLQDILPAVLHHHEWLSGAGYPGGLAGDQIPWVAKVVGLADAFDAMTTRRKYREALPLNAAMAEIRRFAGTQFCPVLVDGLVALVAEGLADRLKGIPKIPAFDNVYTKWIRRADLLT
ncbi:MAG: HD domain-containing protein [Planctomycetes bacterium]|nr:HD domain-containing protein [Planctomycetota bacterium]